MSSDKFNNLSLFQLNKKEVKVLFSVQHWLTQCDIKSTKDTELKNKKKIWLKNWEENVFGKDNVWRFFTGSPPKKIEDIKKDMDKLQNRNKKILIFFESKVFSPYFNTNHKIKFDKNEINTEACRKRWNKHITNIATLCNIPVEQLSELEQKYKDAMSGIAERVSMLQKTGIVIASAIALAITGGMVAPILGSAIGALMGLSGAAATSAGLAFLGGGAIATGGFGMAGGTLAIIGGGALLGSTVVSGGLAATQHLFNHDKIVLSQLAKLEASLSLLKDEENYDQIILTVIKSHKSNSKIIIKLIEETEDQTLRNKLEKSLDYYSKASERIHKIYQSL